MNAEEFSSTTKTIWDAIYEDAARETGKSVLTLRMMGTQVFATMLLHCLQEKGSVIWTASRIEDDGRLTVEVNIRPRYGTGSRV